MEDEKIIDLYWDRSEQAIEETQKKYGQYCLYIANQVLHSQEDAEECVNDAYLGAWNAIPPERPSNLRHFIGCITRRMALNKLDYLNAKKRSADVVSIDEFYECIQDKSAVTEHDETLKNAFNGFLSGLDKRTRVIFMRRYWYCCSIKEISDGMGIGENNVKVILYRTRNKFRKYLEREHIL